MDIKIRKAELSDLNQLVELSIELGKYNAHHSNEHSKFFQEGWETYYKEETEDFLKKPNSASFVAQLQDKLIGFIHAYHSKDSEYSYIDELFILEEYRGNRIGEKLLSEAEKFLKQFDCPVKLEVYSWNNKSISFYKKHGYLDEGIVLEKTL